ncbi:MAG: hypothetical protein SAJ72_12070 [Jaaginema sp. PMC 1080.18]|nr:hypothetical protein [Jaaginema sp. PMC 1080.18]
MTSAFNPDSSDLFSSQVSQQFDLEQSQRYIYEYFLNLVKTQDAEQVLQEFCNLFVHFIVNTDNAEVMQHLADIISRNNLQDFIFSIKRCCYILINNWDTKRDRTYIHKLVNIFAEYQFGDRVHGNKIVRRLQYWLKIFKESPDYQDLCLFTRKYKQSDPAVSTENPETQHWSDRYTSYLLVAQYADPNNSDEQRSAARSLSLQLKNKFKFELAMYATHSQLSRASQFKLKNPTSLGDNVLFLIKKILVKKGYFNYRNLANIFTRQITGLDYQEFKSALIQYLLFSLDTQTEYSYFAVNFRQYIEDLYSEHNEEQLNDSLILRTSNRIVDYLAKGNENFPSEQFVSLICQNHQLTLSIILLKLVLVCPNGRMHLEKRIAELIKYYQNVNEAECEWAIHFFEVFNITFAIYADNDVEYSLIKTRKSHQQNTDEDINLESYHIFSQYRGWPNINTNYYP